MEGKLRNLTATVLFSGSLIVLVFTSGCVRRRLTVRTNPPGAMVSIDNQIIGLSPASSSFVYYAARDVRVEQEGFETQTIRHRMDPPWYQLPPLDFITETLWPGEIRDERVVDIQLTPKVVEPTATVLARADELRLQSRQGVIPVLPPQPAIVPQNPNLPPPSQLLPQNPTPEFGGLPQSGVPYQINPN